MKTCFVIMPIGDQVIDGVKVTAADLRRRYDDLIKEALLQAAPQLEIVRADEIAVPGTVTSDILTRLMHSDIVIADVSFPNPNVFYELGVRHACRVGTVMIKDRAVNGAPFDIAHQRHIAYDNTPSGLKELAKQFRQYFEHFDNNPHKPDNQLLELASLTNYAFPNYKKVSLVDPYVEYALAMINFPEVMEIFATRNIRQIANFDELVKKILLNPDKIMALLNALHKTGDLAEVLSQIPTQNMLPNILQEEDKMSPSNVPRFRKKK